MHIVFDFDGTLHISECVYIPAYHKAVDYLRSCGYEPARDFSDEEIGYWLGYSSHEMWASVAPQAPEELRATCAGIVGDEMLRLADAGCAQMYPGVVDTLSSLTSQGHKLVFLSNCHHNYMETFTRVFGLDRWFHAFYCGEDYGWIPKTRIFDEVMKDLGTSGADPSAEFIMVGDRFHDMAVAAEHHLRSVGCAYGYGAPEELVDATVIVDDPRALLSVIESIVG